MPEAIVNAAGEPELFTLPADTAPAVHVGHTLLVMFALATAVQPACDAAVSADAVLAETAKNLYDGVPLAEVHKSAILAAPYWSAAAFDIRHVFTAGFTYNLPALGGGR